MTEHELFENSSAKDAFLQKFLWQPENVGLDVPLSVADTAANATYYYFADANKNIGQVVDSSGSAVAKYEYSPFGKIVSQSGSYAAANPFRFSSEYFDLESSLVYYNFRYYSPGMGRWLNRDPIGESAFFSNYASKATSWQELASLYEQSLMPSYLFVNNSPFHETDSLGLAVTGGKCCCKIPGTPSFTADTSASPKGNQVTFSALNLRNVGGGCAADVRPMWWTCWTGRIPGTVLDRIFNPWKAPISMGPFTIAAHFRVEYLSCENERWVPRYNIIGSPSCIYVRRFIWRFFGGYWKCGG